MELINWANDNGQTLKLERAEAEELVHALRKAILTGHSNTILELTELDIEITD